MILIIITLLIILLFVPINVKILYDDNYSDVDVYLFKFVKHKFVLDKLIKKLMIDKQKNSLSFKVLFNNIELLLNSKIIIKNLCSQVTIDKCTIILKEDYEDIIKFILFWNMASRFSFLIKKYFKSIKNEYYMITNSKNDISIEIIFKFNIWKIFFVLLFSLKQLIIIFIENRRKKKNGTSNL